MIQAKVKRTLLLILLTGITILAMSCGGQATTTSPAVNAIAIPDVTIPDVVLGTFPEPPIKRLYRYDIPDEQHFTNLSHYKEFLEEYFDPEKPEGYRYSIPIKTFDNEELLFPPDIIWDLCQASGEEQFNSLKRYGVVPVDAVFSSDEYGEVSYYSLEEWHKKERIEEAFNTLSPFKVPHTTDDYYLCSALCADVPYEYLGLLFGERVALETHNRYRALKAIEQYKVVDTSLYNLTDAIEAGVANEHLCLLFEEDTINEVETTLKKKTQ